MVAPTQKLKLQHHLNNAVNFQEAPIILFLLLPLYICIKNVYLYQFWQNSPDVIQCSLVFLFTTKTSDSTHKGLSNLSEVNYNSHLSQMSSYFAKIYK